MRIYLDNCCYNRPFDKQNQLRIRLETEAKLHIQRMMRLGIVEYAWSDILSQEISDSPFPARQEKIFEWEDGAAANVPITPEIVVKASALVARGLGKADALHVVCAEAAGCDWFLTTDRPLLKKLRQYGGMRIANPMEFLVEDENDD